MNNRIGQKFLTAPDLNKVEIANDTYPTHSFDDELNSAEYIQFQQFMRAEKRQSFWGGVAITVMAIFTVFMLIMMFNASGMNFMTCQEFGETFTCRLGGL